MRNGTLQTSSASSLGAEIGKFCKLTGRNIQQVHRGVAIRLYGAIIKTSPVLTGRFRANWLCTLNLPARGTVDETGDTNVQDMQQTCQRAKNGQPIILTNNLPYAHRIEYDRWSHTKAPNGVVRINIARFRRLLREEIRQLRKKQ